MLARSLTNRDAALPVESLKALDWLNFFLAAFLMGWPVRCSASDGKRMGTCKHRIKEKSVFIG
jgi:hypothetical protein